MEYKNIENPLLKFNYVVYPDSTVLNLDNGKPIKPYRDPRRPNLPPTLYLQSIEGPRIMYTFDKLIASLFLENYSDDKYIKHKDDDNNNCHPNNLELIDVVDYINSSLNINKEWKKVKLDDIELLYDYYICEDGKLYNGTTFSIVKPFLDERNKGMQRYALYLSNKKTKKINCNRLVAIHFIPDHPDGKDIVYYRDGDVNNNHYTNLSWGDRYDVVTNRFLLNKDRDDKINSIMGREKWVPLKIENELMYEYEISNYGRVYNKSHEYILSVSNGSKNSNNQSWLYVSLRLKDGLFKKYLLHKLVAIHFIPNDDPENKNRINHINGNPECNWSINLEWCTPLENLRHVIDTNLLHSKEFMDESTSIEWRTKTIISWIISLTENDNDLSKSYNIYTNYCNEFKDNYIEMTYQEFINYFHYNIKTDVDFLKIYNFYNY